jgi:hypothetical protein
MTKQRPPGDQPLLQLPITIESAFNMTVQRMSSFTPQELPHLLTPGGSLISLISQQALSPSTGVKHRGQLRRRSLLAYMDVERSCSGDADDELLDYTGLENGEHHSVSTDSASSNDSGVCNACHPAHVDTRLSFAEKFDHRFQTLQASIERLQNIFNSTPVHGIYLPGDRCASDVDDDCHSERTRVFSNTSIRAGRKPLESQPLRNSRRATIGHFSNPPSNDDVHRQSSGGVPEDSTSPHAAGIDDMSTLSRDSVDGPNVGQNDSDDSSLSSLEGSVNSNARDCARLAAAAIYGYGPLEPTVSRVNSSSRRRRTTSFETTGEGTPSLAQENQQYRPIQRVSRTGSSDMLDLVRSPPGMTRGQDRRHSMFTGNAQAPRRSRSPSPHNSHTGVKQRQDGHDRQLRRISITNASIPQRSRSPPPAATDATRADNCLPTSNALSESVSGNLGVWTQSLELTERKTQDPRFTEATKRRLCGRSAVGDRLDDTAPKTPAREASIRRLDINDTVPESCSVAKRQPVVRRHSLTNIGNAATAGADSEKADCGAALRHSACSLNGREKQPRTESNSNEDSTKPPQSFLVVPPLAVIVPRPRQRRISFDFAKCQNIPHHRRADLTQEENWGCFWQRKEKAVAKKAAKNLADAVGRKDESNGKRTIGDVLEEAYQYAVRSSEDNVSIVAVDESDELPVDDGTNVRDILDDWTEQHDELYSGEDDAVRGLERFLYPEVNKITVVYVRRVVRAHQNYLKKRRRMMRRRSCGGGKDDTSVLEATTDEVAAFASSLSLPNRRYARMTAIVDHKLALRDR